MKYKIKFSYDGTNYSGYQKQPDKSTIQETLENALTTVLREQIEIVASGRTDAGVSAIEQVAHMIVETEINAQRTIGYVNTLLPEDIRINEIERVEEDFHARYSAKIKTYEYWFYIGKEKTPVFERMATHIGYDVDVEKMILATKYFIGEHDFGAFCASNTEVVNKVRTIYDLNIVNLGGKLYKMEITGNGFLYNMVRIIMGTLISVGIGKTPVEQVEKIINSKDRALAGKTMPSKGLYLKKVCY